MSTVHIPILLEPIVSTLILPFQDGKPGWVLDCTLGGGGHTGELLKRLPKNSGVIALDQDEEAISRARKRFRDEIVTGRLILVHSRFGDFESKSVPAITGEKPLRGLLADLGFSSDQLEDGDRGISFQREGPLDMRLDRSSGESAYNLLRRSTERELADLIYEFGEERNSRRIASSIIEARRKGSLPTTTVGLAELIFQATPGRERHGRIHPATRTFQALRIAVNAELEELDRLMTRVILEVSVGGRIAILSFHSLEDRAVKIALKDDRWKALSKKPIEASDEEMALNPRSRSAKLRTAERVRSLTQDA